MARDTFVERERGASMVSYWQKKNRLQFLGILRDTSIVKGYQELCFIRMEAST